MESLTRYTIAIVFSSVAALFLLENLFPLRPRRRPLVGRLAINIALSLVTYAIGNFVVRKTANLSIDWAEAHSFGLSRLVGLPGWVEFGLLDLTFYYWHRFTHWNRLLWRFHQVHHFDPDMDVSTGFRFHFGEVGLSTFFRAGQALLLGVSFPIYAFYELAFQVAVYFHHSNLRLPEIVDRALRVIFVTPRMHGVHHSQVPGETHSCFSTIFSVWDRIHGTFRWNEHPVTGLPEIPNPGLKDAFLAPFSPARSVPPPR